MIEPVVPTSCASNTNNNIIITIIIVKKKKKRMEQTYKELASYLVFLSDNIPANSKYFVSIVGSPGIYFYY